MTPADAPRDDRWLDCEEHLNQRLLGPLLDYYVRTRGIDIEKFARELGTTVEVLRDRDRWFSTELFQVVIDKMIEQTGDPDVAYQAGRALAWPEMLGPERLLTVGVGRPLMAYTRIQDLGERVNRIVQWHVRPLGEGRAIATARLTDNNLDTMDFCRNRIGVLEAIPEAFNLRPARVFHHECIHKGAAACVYDVRWTARSPLVPVGWAGTALLAAGSVVALVVGSAWATPLLGATAVLAILTGFGGLLSQSGTTSDELRATLVEQEEIKALLDRNDRRLGELGAIQAVMEAASDLRSENELVDAVLGRLQEGLDYDRVMLLRVHGEGKRLGRPLFVGFDEAVQRRLESIDLSATEERPDNRLFANILQSGRAELVQVDDGYLAELKPEFRQLFAVLGSTAFVAAPVLGPQTDGAHEALGLLVVDRTDRLQSLSLRDRDLLSNVASTLGNAISNVRYLRDQLLADRKFRQYLPSAVVEQIRMDPEQQLKLGGEERDLAVMFTDIAGFTPLTAALPASDVVHGLNAWFRLTDPVIAACNGIVDKRMGDGILVVFLDERSTRGGRHPVERAAAAAVRMFEELSLHRPELGVFQSMQVRHAIHFGKAIVGNMGSLDRMEYTVIGDTVNVGARLEEITKAGQAWITGEAIDAVEGGLDGVEFVEEVWLRGRDEKTRIYRIIVEEVEPTDTGTWGTADSATGVTASLTASFEPEPEPEPE